MVNLTSFYSRPCALASINFKTEQVFGTVAGDQAFGEPNKGRVRKRNNMARSYRFLHITPWKSVLIESHSEGFQG